METVTRRFAYGPWRYWRRVVVPVGSTSLLALFQRFVAPTMPILGYVMILAIPFLLSTYASIVTISREWAEPHAIEIAGRKLVAQWPRRRTTHNLAELRVISFRGDNFVEHLSLRGVVLKSANETISVFAHIKGYRELLGILSENCEVILSGDV